MSKWLGCIRNGTSLASCKKIYSEHWCFYLQMSLAWQQQSIGMERELELAWMRCIMLGEDTKQ